LFQIRFLTAEVFVLKINTPDSQETPSLEGYPVGAIFTLKTDGIDSETGN